FVSRIDTAVEVALAGNPAARGLDGKVAIASAKLAYQHYQEVTKSARWAQLADRGAQTQRLLWASTSSKNPAYRDVLYVEELIGAETVNTIPPGTFNAFRDHGRLRASLADDVDGAYETMQSLARAGVSIDAITDRLLDDGIDQFVEAFTRLLQAVGSRLGATRRAKVDRQVVSLPADAQGAVTAALTDWQNERKVSRLWRLDASLWTGSDEGQWLGWLGITDDQIAHLDAVKQMAADVKSSGFTHALLL